MEPSVLIFDLGNVLWQLDYSGWLTHIQTFNRSISESDLRDFIANVLLEADTRDVPDVEYLANYRKVLQLENLTIEGAYNIHVRLLAKGPTKAMSLLPLLKKQHRLFLISNINPWHKRYFEESYPQHEVLFERKVYSYETGVKKPSPAIFDYFRNLAHVDFEHAIFFDDLKENVDAANALGLASLLVENDDSFCTYLTKRFLNF